jgi:Fe-Mn family superoxide dismutase
LIVAHYENVYGASVRALNEVRARLAAIDIAAASAPEIRALKQEELETIGSVTLHELYFASLGTGSSGYRGDGEIPGAILDAMKESFGGMSRWKGEFVALARALAGRSGWVVLGYQPSGKRLVNHLVLEDSQAAFHHAPLLALDMYEHAYFPEFGANVDAYIDAFLRNIDWESVAGRLNVAGRAPDSQTAGPGSEACLASISAEELSEKFAKSEPVQIVDARPRHYFSKAVDMMDAATWRDPERVDDWCGTLSKDVPVAVYCAYGFHVGCGVTAVLRDRGFDARFLRGGLSAWYGIGGARKLRPGASIPQR